MLDTVLLLDHDGELVGRVEVPRVGPFFTFPEVVVWRSRVFIRDDDASVIDTAYREALVHVCDDQS